MIIVARVELWVTKETVDPIRLSRIWRVRKSEAEGSTQRAGNGRDA